MRRAFPFAVYTSQAGISAALCARVSRSPPPGLADPGRRTRAHAAARAMARDGARELRKPDDEGRTARYALHRNA
jgi:hypothetical protein